MDSNKSDIYISGRGILQHIVKVMPDFIRNEPGQLRPSFTDRIHMYKLESILFPPTNVFSVDYKYSILSVDDDLSFYLSGRADCLDHNVMYPQYGKNRYIGFRRSLRAKIPDCLEDFFERNIVSLPVHSLFYKPVSRFNKVNDFISDYFKMDPWYYAYIADLGIDLNKAVLKLSIGYALNQTKTLIDTLFLDNLTELFGYEGKPVRWCDGFRTLVDKTTSPELKELDEFLMDSGVKPKPEITFKCNPLLTEVFGILSSDYGALEFKRRWIFKPFKLTKDGKIGYKLESTFATKPDFADSDIRMRGDIRE